MRLDDIDEKILRIIQEDADISMHELGRMVDLSHTPCWRRVKKLEERGFIRQRVTLLDPLYLDLSVNVLVNVTLQRHKGEEIALFEEMITEIPEVVECYSVSGETDYLLRVVVRSVSDYELLLRNKLIKLPAVGNLNSTFALRQIKYTTELPLESVDLTNLTGRDLDDDGLDSVA